MFQFCSELEYLDVSKFDTSNVINMKTGMLTCLNNNCNFISNPNKIIWTCNVCQKECGPKRVRARPCPRTTRGKNEGRYLEVNF